MRGIFTVQFEVGLWEINEVLDTGQAMKVLIHYTPSQR
jgi:hypothetical protein